MVIESRTVFVVEDDEDLLRAIERLLGAAGYPSCVFDSAEAVLASGAPGDAACIVSDLKLPGRSGLELLAELRARGVTTPLILMTAHDAPGQREAALGRGVAAYLAKPFRGTALLEAIGRIAEPIPRP